MKDGVKTLNKKDSNAGTSGYSSTKELALKYVEGDGRRLWSAKRMAELDLWPRLIGALLILDGGKKNEVCIPNSKGPFLKKETDCLNAVTITTLRFWRLVENPVYL